MNRTVQKGNQWVWTELTEFLRGVKYPMTEIRKAGQPVMEWRRQTVPASWVEKGYVQESPIEGQLTLFEVV